MNQGVRQVRNYILGLSPIDAMQLWNDYCLEHDMHLYMIFRNDSDILQGILEVHYGYDPHAFTVALDHPGYDPYDGFVTMDFENSFEMSGNHYPYMISTDEPREWMDIRQIAEWANYKGGEHWNI